MSQLHVVFGTGPIGLATIHHLVARDLPVRAVNRSGRADVPTGVELVAANAADAAAATDAAAGASVMGSRKRRFPSKAKSAPATAAAGWPKVH